MPNQNESKVDSVGELEPDEVVLPVKPQRRVRPMVEGINAPVVKSASDIVYIKPTLTEREKKLVEDLGNFQPMGPRLMPESVKIARKKNYTGLWIALAVILLGLAVGYKWYADYLPDSLNFLKDNESAQTDSLQEDNPDIVTQQISAYPIANQELPTAATSSPSADTASASSTLAASLPKTAVKRLKVNQTSVGYLNVRSEASSASKLTAKINPGQVYEYTEQKNGWYKIVLPTGQNGWVSGQYVSEQ